MTHAEVEQAAAREVDVITTPPSMQPIHDLGMPAPRSRIEPIAISCPARMTSAPIQSSDAAIAAHGASVAVLEIIADGAQVVRRRPCARIPGPIQKASTSEPIAADPTHHHAARPSL